MKPTKIAVAIDGSEYSQNASLTSFWIGSAIGAEVEAISIVDPRVVDLFLSPEFAEDIGLKPSIDASAVILKSLKRISTTVLNLWAVDCEKHLKKAGKTYLILGDTTNEILKRSKAHDLIVVGHRGVGYKNHQPTASHFRIGAVAERVAVGSKKSVLIAAQPPAELKSILVAYDGSEPSKGALLLAEQLALKTKLPLKAIHVVKQKEQIKEASSTLELGASLLREYQRNDSLEATNNGALAVKDKVETLMNTVFCIEVGQPDKIILDKAQELNALLVVGAYGFKNPEDNVMGSTTTQIVRATRTSVLVYR